MRRFLFQVLFLAAAVPAFAAEAPVKQDAPGPGAADGLTINDCFAILTGLSRLDDGFEKVVSAGKPTESKISDHYDLPPALRDAQTHDLFVLGQIQQEVQTANRRAQLEIGHGEAIKPGSVEELKFQDRMAEYTSRPCPVQLDHIRKDDLMKAGPIPGTIRALLWKITD